jgi:hypothetical protein
MNRLIYFIILDYVSIAKAMRKLLTALMMGTTSTSETSANF